MEQFMHLSHSVGQNTFHLVWKPKWNWDPFKFVPVQNCCVAALRVAARRWGFRILELEVMPDHVHIFVELPPRMSVSKVLQCLKGFSSRMLFKHFPWLRRYFRTGHFWSPGKFFRSVGSVSDEAIRHYIAQTNRGARNQRLLTGYPGL